jgi:hypothetical protein|tara:strand:- start:451 stop:738 length:288 start_codon:yes stop_codon:yes gene_type:complete
MPTVISKNAPVTITLGLLIVLGAGVWHLSAAISSYKDSNTYNFKSLQEQITKIDDRWTEAWSYPMMREYDSTLHHLNPEITVPKVDEIKQFHTKP